MSDVDPGEASPPAEFLDPPSTLDKLITRLDEERYWRNQNEQRKARDRKRAWVAAIIAGVILAAVLVVGAVLFSKLSDQTNAIRATQLESSRRGKAILAVTTDTNNTAVILGCAIAPSVQAAQGQDAKNRALLACITRNGVDPAALDNP